MKGVFVEKPDDRDDQVNADSDFNDPFKLPRTKKLQIEPGKIKHDHKSVDVVDNDVVPIDALVGKKGELGVVFDQKTQEFRQEGVADKKRKMLKGSIKVLLKIVYPYDPSKAV